MPPDRSAIIRVSALDALGLSLALAYTELGYTVFGPGGAIQSLLPTAAALGLRDALLRAWRGDKLILTDRPPVGDVIITL